MGATTRTAFTCVLTFATASCMFFAQQPSNSPSASSSCSYNVPLQEVSLGMANQSQDNIFNHLLPNILIPRVSGSQGSAFVREFIKSEMSRLGWAVEEDTFTSSTPYGPITFSNVIATLNPSATTRYVVACHHDSKYMPGPVPFLGATDSAVPCAIMLDSAKQMRQAFLNDQANSFNDFTLQFIFFDGEEAFVQWTALDSIYGSRHLAARWANMTDPRDPSGAVNNLYNIELFVLLDLIGTYDTRIQNHFANTASYFNSLQLMEQCLEERGLLTSRNRRDIFVGGRTYRVQDDHIPFLQRGVPILHLISTPFPSVWHTSADNLASLDANTVDDFARIFRLFLATISAGNSPTPSFL